MNVDALSLALAQISYQIKNLAKNNLKSSLAEISNLVHEHGFEAERHFYRTLFASLELATLDETTAKRPETIQWTLWIQELPNLLSKTNFITLICYAVDNALSQKLMKIPATGDGRFLSNLCQMFQLNFGRELLFVLALENSVEPDLAQAAREHWKRRLPEFLQVEPNESGLSALNVEAIHTLLTEIHRVAPAVVNADQYEQFLQKLRPEFANALILQPILFPWKSATTNNELSTSVVSRMNESLADLILEMGYDFTASTDDCRNALVHIGLKEFQPATVARILTAMIRTHSGLNGTTRIFESNGTEVTLSHDKPTWNVETFVITLNNLIPTLNWKDVVKELDHPSFMIRDRQGFLLLITALRRALPVEQFIEQLYARWTHLEGQLSWLAQSIRYPEIFCLGDYLIHSVAIECLKHPLEDSKDVGTWRSLNLIESLLRIADSGFQGYVLDIFKHGIQRAGEVIFLGLLQLHTIWTTLKQELFQLIIPTFVLSSPNANVLLNAMWNSPHHQNPLRITFLTSLADWYNRANENEQQQRLGRVLEIVQDLKALLTLLSAQPITFILDLACLASRRGYLKLDKWLTDKFYDHQDLFLQTTIQYLRKKAPQLLHSTTSLKDDSSAKSIANIETIQILLGVLQLALPSLTNVDLIQEIQTMNAATKHLNNLSNTIFRPLPKDSTSNDLPNSANPLPTMNEVSDVDFYFKRLYSKTNNPPAITVEEFLDALTKCKDSPNAREKEIFLAVTKNLFDEYKYYYQYPERELLLNAQLFGGLIERGLFLNTNLINGFKAIIDGLKKPVGSNLWNFAVTVLDRCKARAREQPSFIQTIRLLPTYHEIPLSIREYFDMATKAIDPIRTLTPTGMLPSQQQQQPVATSPHSHLFQRIHSTPSMTTSSAPYSAAAKENPAQKGPSLNQNADIGTLISDPSYNLVRIKPPPGQINDKIAFTFNNLSFSNLSQKADELKETLRNDEQLWKWVAQYLVLRRVSIEPNFHSLYAGFLSTLNMTLLYETVLTETHRNIKILLLSDKQLNNIRDRSLLKNLGHWLGIITIGRNKPILATDLEIKSLTIEAFHMGSQELLYIIPFVAKILESCSKSKIFQQPNPWLMGIMSVLAEMHGTPDFKLNLKFEIEVLCKQLEIQLSDLPIHNILMNREYFEKISKQLTSAARQPPSASPVDPMVQAGSLSTARVLQESNATAAAAPAALPVPKYKLSDFKPSIFQSLNSMLEINPNILLFRQHPHLKTYIHTPIEQAINESFQTVQRSLKVATSAAETIVRKDFLFNPDEQQLRTSARNMVAYLSSGLVLITARAPLQEQIQSYIKTHFLTVLGISQTTNLNVNEQATSEMIQQAALEIATANIELCCCLLQRITISRAIQLIDQRLANDIDIRQRCRAEGRQLPTGNANLDERLPEQIRLHYGPLSSHQLAIYEDFVHFIPGFKPNDSEKRDIGPMDESVPSVWDRLISEIDQTIQSQQNQIFGNALQRLLDSLNLLRTHLQNQSSNSSPQAALANVLNIILCNFLEHFTYQSQIQDSENFERFKTIHMNVLKLLIEIRLHISVINKQLTKSWLECSAEMKFNIYAVSHLMRNRLLDIRQIDSHVAQLIDTGNNGALHFAVNFLRMCVIEQASCADTDISNILDSLHRISLIGKQPAEAVRDLLEIIRLNYTSANGSTTGGETGETPKHDKLATTALSVISNGLKYLSAIDDIETATIVNKAKHILSDWITLTMTQTNRINQQQAFQEVFNQMNVQGILRSDDTIAKFLRTTIQLCVNSVYDLIRQAQPISSSGNPQQQQQQQPQYARCHQGIDSLCRFLYLLTIHTSDNMNFSVRIHLINRMLGILAALCYWDHEEQGEQFHPLAYQRIILNLFQESTANATTTPSTVDNPASSSTSSTSSSSSSSSSDHVMYYIYLAFTNCLHLLRPQRAPAFAFAWLEIVAHRTFLSRFLLSGGRFARQIHNMYALLLVDALRLVAPFIRSGENTPSFQTYYKGILKTFMLLLHDFPEFLCEHYYEFCDCLPLISHQLRNVILSSFPKHIRCPDPFKVNIKIEMLSEISIPPSISFNYAMNIQPAKFKHNLDSYLRTRSPVTFLSELRSYLQQGSDPGSHYNIRMLNALVLYVATQALATLNNRTPLMSSITHTAHMDIFQNLAVDLDTEGRYLFLNAMANHLRYPNTHTHYFSYTILYLFAEANSEALQEQIVRVLLERLVANRPHPWGLLVTFLELVRNPNLKLWSREFMSISPDVKRLLSTLTQGFPQFPASPMTTQASTIVKP